MAHFWDSLLAWPPTSSTIAGVSTILGTGTALAMSDMTPATALPLLAGAACAILMPQNTALKGAAMQLTEDMIVAPKGGSLTLVGDAEAVAAALNQQPSGAATIAKTAGMSAIALLALGGLSACSSTAVDSALQSSAGQLFCAINQDGGSQVVVGVIDAEASATLGAAAPVAVLATGMAASDVQNDCAKAAAAVGAKSAIPVSPPATAVANVAIKTSTSN